MGWRGAVHPHSRPGVHCYRLCYIHAFPTTTTPLPAPPHLVRPHPYHGKGGLQEVRRGGLGAVRSNSCGGGQAWGASPFPRRSSQKPRFWVQVLSSQQPSPQPVLGDRATSRLLEMPMSLQWM